MAATETAKAIRQELKTAFPSIKFSVRASKNSINVEWTGGPSSKEVEAITNKYETIHKDEYMKHLCGGDFFVYAIRNIG